MYRRPLLRPGGVQRLHGGAAERRLHLPGRRAEERPLGDGAEVGLDRVAAMIEPAGEPLVRRLPLGPLQVVLTVDILDDACIDAMQELSNVTCGLLLPELASCEKDTFDMTIPKTQWLQGQQNWNDFIEDENSHVMNIEDYLVAAKLTMEK